MKFEKTEIKAVFFFVLRNQLDLGNNYYCDPLNRSSICSLGV